MKAEKKTPADVVKKPEEMDAAPEEVEDEAGQAEDSIEEEDAETQTQGNDETEESEADEDASADDVEDTVEGSGDAEGDSEETDVADAAEAETDAGKDADERAKALDERERTLLARELRATAIEELAKEQLPSALADCFRYDSEAAFKQSKESVIKAFQGALKEAVDARLRGKPPKTAESAKGSKVSGHNFSDIINKNKARR